MSDPDMDGLFKRGALPEANVQEEVKRLRELSHGPPGIVDVNAEATASALEKIDERLEALEILHGAEHQRTAERTPGASDLIALCAVIVDEAEAFVRQRIDVRDRGVDCNGAVLDAHAQRCLALHQKLCAAASRSAVRDGSVAALLDVAATALVGGSPPSDLTEDFAELQDFKNTVVYALHAERNPDLALDALEARLKERQEYRDFLLQVTLLLKLSGEHCKDAALALDTLKARLEEYQVLFGFLLDTTRVLCKPGLVPGVSAPEEVLLALKAGLKERELYQKFLLDVASALGLPGSADSHTNAEHALQILKERLKKESP